MNRQTEIVGKHSAPAGQLKTYKNGNNDRFYIEIEFNQPVNPLDLAKLGNGGNIYDYARGIIQMFEGQGEY